MPIETPDKANASLYRPTCVRAQRHRAPTIRRCWSPTTCSAASPNSRLCEPRPREGRPELRHPARGCSRQQLRAEHARSASSRSSRRRIASGSRTAISEEIERALRGRLHRGRGIADAKRALLQQRTLARSQDRRVAGALCEQAYLGRTWAYSGQDRRSASNARRRRRSTRRCANT